MTATKSQTAALVGLLDRAGDPRTVMRQLVNAVANTRGLTPPWDVPPATGLEPFGDLAGWGVVELGEARAALLPARRREAHGIVYTPPEVVDFQVRAAMQAGRLDRLAGHPDPLAHILLHDPFCGCGIFLIAGARHVARWYAAQLTCASRVDLMADAVLPAVMVECIYGNDLDEVAVDVARSVCWLEIGGVQPITFMDHNIVVADTFAEDFGERAPKLTARWDAASGTPVGAPR